MKADKTIIAFRGTEKKDWDDYKSDVAMIRGHIPNQAYKAEQYYNLIKNKYKNVTFTGHSLGGTIAQYLNQQTGLPAYCFAPFGCKAINKLSKNCINLGYESDIIYNICLDYLRGNVYIFPDSTWQGTYIKKGKIEPIAFSKRLCYPSIQKHQLESWGELIHDSKILLKNKTCSSRQFPSRF